MRMGEVAIARVAVPDVDGGQRPATARQDAVRSHRRRQAHRSGSCARPVLEDAGGTAEGDPIRTVGPASIPVDEVDRLTKVLRSKRQGGVRR